MTGWYGKIPQTGDFVARRLPASFRDAWDAWLQGAMRGSRERLGGRWRDDFLSMPAWRFVLGPGLVSREAWAGLMVPSVDSVGRHFPLTAAAALPPSGTDIVTTLFAAAPWFRQLEAIALSALEECADAGALDARISAHPWRADATIPEKDGVPRTLVFPAGLAAPAAAWLSEAAEPPGGTLLLCAALPPAEQYCAMLDGRWTEHGWGPR